MHYKNNFNRLKESKSMKYAIKKEFGIYKFLRFPLNKAVLHLAKFFLSAMPKGMHSSKELQIEKIKDKNFNAYVIKPKLNAKQTIFYMHGGGFVFKGAKYHYKLAKTYALKSQSNVIFVDYSLAFEKYGHPLDDCVDAYKYFLVNKQKFGIDENKICFVGDSAGAYLALALYDRCKKEKMTLPTRIMLVYPVINPLMQSDSMKKFSDTPMWNSKLNKKMWQIYSKENEVFNPNQADLSGFPETYIETAQFDCLHDEGVNFYNKLSKAGVKCVLNETKGTMHGFDIKLKSPTTQNSIEKRVEFLNNT